MLVLGIGFCGGSGSVLRLEMDSLTLSSFFSSLTPRPSSTSFCRNLSVFLSDLGAS